MVSFRRLTRATVLVACLPFATSTLANPATYDTHLVLCWNDLGMHCMSADHSRFSILPPYNTLVAQVIARGDATRLPHVVAVTYGLALEYSIPGNSYSAGKTNFWDWAELLFGVPLPPDVGLTGRGLSGTFTPHATYLDAEGIPITPYPDATPSTEDPYQQALVILRDSLGNELHRSTPVIPVSAEVNCVSMDCHASEQEILDEHPQVPGFDPGATPILCASCHGSTPLTGPFPGPGDWFSLRVHGQHTEIDQQFPGADACYKCHPGPNTRCLRDVMATSHGLICQDCHGTLQHLAQTVDGGRIPWLQEPACRECHTAAYGEPAGILFRNAVGHGGVRCTGCHGSPHAIFTSRESRDNSNCIALQGHAGTLDDCRVCHGVVPPGAGPHGLVLTSAVERELTAGAGTMEVYPNPCRPGMPLQILVAGANLAGGRLLVYDAGGRIVCRLEARPAGTGIRAQWDGRNAQGGRISSGVYFVRWSAGADRAVARVVILE